MRQGSTYDESLRVLVSRGVRVLATSPAPSSGRITGTRAPSESELIDPTLWVGTRILMGIVLGSSVALT